MSGYCDWCHVWHSGPCCHPGRPTPTKGVAFDAPSPLDTPTPLTRALAIIEEERGNWQTQTMKDVLAQLAARIRREVSE